MLPTCSGKVYENISQHRQVDLITGDGNCLFRSLSKSIFGVQAGHVILRVLLTTFILRNKMVPGKFCNGEVDDHCGQMAKNGTFGTQAEIHAAAAYFQVPIFTFCISARNWHWIKFTPVLRTLLDFAGCPLITPPPPLFRIKLLHHSSHYDRISPNTTKQLPPPSLPGREDRGIIKLSDTHAPCMHMTQTVQATVLFLAQLYLPVNFQTSLAVDFHLL